MSRVINVRAASVAAPPPPGTTAIEIAADALTVPGSSADFATTGLLPPLNVPPPNTDRSSAWLNWSHRFFWNPVQKTAHFNTKIQAPTTTNWIGDYDSAANNWNTTEYQFPNTARGHAYSWPCFDYTSGTMYYVENGGNVIGGLQSRLALRLIGAARNEWVYFAEGQVAADLGANDSILANSSSGAFGDEGGMHVHPNLYGAGQPGLVISCSFGIIGYNLATNTFTAIVNRLQYADILNEADASQSNNSSVVYIPSLDACFASTGFGQLLRIDSATSWARVGDTPANVQHDSGGINYIKIVDDPAQRGYFWGFGFTGSLSTPQPHLAGILYKYNVANGLLEQAGTHPFSLGIGGVGDGQALFAACYGFTTPVVACLMGGSSTAQGQSVKMKLWRPL